MSTTNIYIKQNTVNTDLVENNKENNGMYGKRIEWQALTVRIKYAVQKGKDVTVLTPYRFVDGSERFHINIVNTYNKIYKFY